jgi:hypothetical protein
LVNFRNAYVEMFNSVKVDRSDWAEVRIVPKVSNDRWAELMQRTARTSGEAVAAYLRSGGTTMTLRNAAYVMQNVNPIVNWEMSLRDPDMMQPTAIVSAVDNAIGYATTRYKEAKMHERGPVGVIASFLRWPQTLREAVGPGAAPRFAAGAIGVVGQIVVATVGGALATGLVAAAIALWRGVFPE